MNKRRQTILSILEEYGEIDVENLVDMLSVSESTIRRDLTILQEEGKLIRTLGGAQRMSELFISSKNFEIRKRNHFQEKMRIADAAASMISPGMTVALDNGTSVWCLLTKIRTISSITVITNSLQFIWDLGAMSNVSLISIGGEFRLKNLDFIGPKTIQSYKEWHADIAFLGVNSIRPGKGLYKTDQQDASICQAISQTSDKCVALLDHTKINGSGACLAVSTGNIDCIITDSGIDAQVKRLLIESEPYEVVIV